MITGATGFAGSFLVEWYVARGWSVHGTFRTPGNRVPDAHEGAELHQVDLRDSHAVDALVRSVKPTLVHHLAAQSSVSASFLDPVGTLQDNARSQYNVLEAVASTAHGARVLVVGSCDEYGDVHPSDNPVDENQELRPINPYALSKVAQDLMGYQYHVVTGLDIVRVRPFLQMGPRRSDMFVAGSFARQIAEVEAGLREPQIDVGNVDLIRDFTDVRDVANGFAMVAERGEAGTVYNLASGEGHTLREMLDIMVHRAGVPVDILSHPERFRRGEPTVLLGDASRLRTTGWRPNVSFERSVCDTLDYWRARISSQVEQERLR